MFKKQLLKLLELLSDLYNYRYKTTPPADYLARGEYYAIIYIVSELLKAVSDREYMSNKINALTKQKADRNENGDE